MKAPANFIRKYRKERHLTLEQLSELTNISTSHLNRMENGGRSVNTLNLHKIAEVLRVSPASLISGEALTSAILSDNVRVVGHLQAGEWGDTVMWPEEQQYDVLVKEDQRFRGFSRQAFEIRGNSMNLRFPPGTVVVIVPFIELDRQPRSGETVVVQRRNRLGEVEASCKEYIVDDAGKAWLWPRSNDPMHQAPLLCEPEDGDDSILITGRVIQAITPV
jgi:transcriptional regulator with XRE-family HTH domain